MSDSHGPKYYIKIYLVLVVLFIISVLGPELGYRAVTLVTAFGIAVVKAVIVAAYFMHLNVEKKYVHYVLYSMLLLMGILYAGIRIDIEATRGGNWVNESSEAEIEQFNGMEPEHH